MNVLRPLTRPKKIYDQMEKLKYEEKKINFIYASCFFFLSPNSFFFFPNIHIMIFGAVVVVVSFECDAVFL